VTDGSGQRTPLCASTSANIALAPGGQAEESIGRSIDDLDHPDDRSQLDGVTSI